MKVLSQTLALSGALLALAISAQHANAQAEPKTDGAQKGAPGRGRGNFDPEEFRRRASERMREAFDVKNDDEWKLISERIEKVSEARRGTGGGFGGFPGGAPGGFRGGPPGGGDRPDAGGTRTRTASGGSTEAQELQKALEAKASNDEIKAKLAKLRESRKASEAKLEKAQAELLEVLSVRQEAVAVMFGLLK